MANMEAAYADASRGDLRQFAGHMEGVAQCLETEPGTLGEETPDSVREKATNLLIARAEEHRKKGNNRKYFEYMVACELLLRSLVQNQPDKARWHYYSGLHDTLFATSSDLDSALEEFQLCLDCSDAKLYAGSARRMIAYCQAEKKRQREALRRQAQAIDEFLRRNPGFFSPGSTSAYIPCPHCHQGWAYSKGTGYCSHCHP